jgi:hypothetical protein
MAKPAEESDKKHGDPFESAIQNAGGKRAVERKETADDDLELDDDDNDAADDLDEDDSNE